MTTSLFFFQTGPERHTPICYENFSLSELIRQITKLPECTELRRDFYILFMKAFLHSLKCNRKKGGTK